MTETLWKWRKTSNTEPTPILSSSKDNDVHNKPHPVQDIYWNLTHALLSQAPSLHGVKVVASGARQFVDGPLPAALDVPGGLLAAQEGVLPVRESLTAGVL